jgi:monoamine oxidase
MTSQDVIVIGAGFTGLTAANILAKAGMDVVLREARDRVGGRVESMPLADGTRIDSGGQFLCEDMPELMRLAQKYDKTFIRSDDDGGIVFQPKADPEAGYKTYLAVDALRAKMATEDLGDPDIASLTVSQWLARQDVGDDVKQGFAGLVSGLWCRSPDDIAFAYLASNDRRITNTQSELEFYLAETMFSLAEDLAAGLGDRLRLNSPVTRVLNAPEGVEVVSGTRSWQARELIVAVPPVMAGRLEFDPPLPGHLTSALGAWGAGHVIKALVRYARPFWRDRGLSGTVMWRDPLGLYACDASLGDKAALVVFFGGPLAETWHASPQAELRRYISDSLMAALGPEAGEIIEISLRDWVDDRWSGGAYGDLITDVHANDAESVLLAGLPSIRFAASELSPSYPGYIEGAIVAGKQAADAIIAERRHSDLSA